MKDALIYPLADALNLALHEMKDGRVRGSGTRMLSTGGWTFEAEIMVVSDVVEEHRAGYFVRLCGNLWLYVLVEAGGLTTMMSFDANVVGLKVKDIKEFGGLSIEATITKLHPAIRKTFSYHAHTSKWTEVAVADLESVA